MTTNPAKDPSTADRAGTNRRRWLFGAVAGVGTLAGVGLAWWNGEFSASDPARLPLWDLTFDTPQGAQLPMQAFAGKPLLLNFWATWCPPCIEEMPLLDRFFAANSANGWQVLGLAIDKQPAVVQFLERTPVRFPIAMAGMAGSELTRSLGNKSGGLPFTAVFDARGNIAHRKLGRVTEAELQQWRAGLG